MVQSPSWEANWFAASQEIRAFHGTRRLITALTRLRHPSLSWASPIQSVYTHPTSWRSILILFTHLLLGFPSGLLPSGFPTETHYTPYPHPYAPHAQPISFFSILSPAQYWVTSTDHLAPRYAISSFPRYLVLPRSKYSPQHPVLKHPQLPFLPQCQRPSFTPIQNNRQNKIIFIFIFTLKCGAGGSWRRSAGPIMWEKKKCYKVSRRRGTSYIKRKENGLTGLVTSCVRTAFSGTLFKERLKAG